MSLSRLALLLGLEIVLARFLSIATPSVKIGRLLRHMGDIVDANLFPIGPYFPGFTVTAHFSGLVFGRCLYKGRSQRWGWIICAVTVKCVGFSLLFNTLRISMLYGTPCFTLLPIRALQCILLILIQTVVLRLLGTRRFVCLP